MKIKKIEKSVIDLTYLSEAGTELDLPFLHSLHTMGVPFAGNKFFLLIY
jgi:hypothetical protein